MYLPWFPSGFICGYFTYEIEAECDSTYQLRSYGSYTKTNGTWHFERMIPDFDINLVASKSLKTMERVSGGYRVFFHYESLQDKTAERLSNDLASILDCYATWFGEDKKGEIFTVIQSPREKGGDYARKGLIVLSRLTDEKYIAQHELFVRNLGHETAHFWWNMAPANSWEDWLNESFAEYSALLIIRKMFGAEAYNKWIADKNAAVKNIPPIWGFDRNNMKASEGPDIIEANLYSKGPLLLHQLSSRIGDEAFKLLCHEMIRTSVSSTDSFLSLLEKNHGGQIRTLFEDLLKSY
jgi:aminopeptidase N